MGSIERIIFHIDVNSAFLSWSALEHLKADPTSVDLRTIPSAVGGDVEERHGIITAKSIPAKKYGVTTGEPVVKALQKCPTLKLVRSDFQAYRRYSAQFMELLYSYTTHVQRASIDEAYLDVTDVLRERIRMAQATDWTPGEKSMSDESNDYELRQAAVALAHEMKDRIYRELKFTVNVGVSVNKLLAKTASDFTKPDRVHTLFPEELPEKYDTLPIRDLFGCGPATSAKLESIGVHTIGDAREMSEEILQSHLGNKAGSYIYNSSRGFGSDHVECEERVAKSYSNEMTTSVDVCRDNYEVLGLPLVRELSEHVSRRLVRDGVKGRTIFIQAKTDDFQRLSRQAQVARYTNDAQVIYREARALMDELVLSEGGLFDQRSVLRLIGVGVTNLGEELNTYSQMNMEDFAKISAEHEAKKKSDEKHRSADEMMEQIRKRFGDGVIQKGSEK